MLYEPRNRAGRIYTVKSSEVSSSKKAITKAKQRFEECSDYDYDELRASKLEETPVSCCESVMSIVVSVKHSVYRQE